MATVWYPEFAKAVEAHCQNNTYDMVQASEVITYGYLRYAKGTMCRVLGPVSDHAQSVWSGIPFAKSWRKKLVAILGWRAYRYFEAGAYRHSDWVLFYSDRDLKRTLAHMPGIVPCPLLSYSY